VERDADNAGQWAENKVYDGVEDAEDAPENVAGEKVWCFPSGHNIGPQDSSRKKPTQIVSGLATTDDASLLAAWIEIAQQDLKSEKEKVKVLEKEFKTLKEAKKFL
jgi:hypothetical protein